MTPEMADKIQASLSRSVVLWEVLISQYRAALVANVGLVLVMILVFLGAPWQFLVGGLALVSIYLSQSFIVGFRRLRKACEP